MLGKVRASVGKVTGRGRYVVEAPIARLVRNEQLDIYEHTAADEIVAAHGMSIGEQVARDPDLGIPSDPQPHAADNAAAHRVDILAKFGQWKRDLRSTVPGRVALGVLFDETQLRLFDSREHWRKGTAREHLRVALRHFAALRGNVPKGARGWKFSNQSAPGGSRQKEQ